MPRYATEGSLARNQSLGYSERASCTLSWAGQLSGRSWNGVLACKCSPCGVVVGVFCVWLLLKSDQFDFLAAGFLSNSFWATCLDFMFFEML